MLEAGERLRSAERLEQAQTLLQRCLEASQREWDLRLVEVRSLYLLGCVQRRLGKEEKADVYFERGLEVCLQTMRLAPALRYDLSRWGLALVEAGSAGPTVLCDWSLFAGAEALEAELWPQARELFEQAWELSEQSRGAAKRGAAATLGLALAYEHVGELEQAASCARRALAFAEQDDPSLASRSDEFYGEARAQHKAFALEPFLLRLFHLEKQLGNSDQARRLLGRMVMLKTGDMATLLSQARTELTHIREVAAWGCPDLVGVLHPRA